MTTLFSMECMIKIFVFGLVINGKSSYLQSFGNLMDFFIVGLSIVSLTPLSVNLQIFKILRMVRVLRPLRMISRNEGLKIVVESLINAIPGIVNVMVITSMLFLLFGILGTNYFKGTFYACSRDTEPQLSMLSTQPDITTMADCINVGGYWKNKDTNFDNVFNSMLILFEMSTTEGWIDVMWNGVDAV